VLTCRQPPDPQPAACAYLQPALPRTAELLIVIRFRILSRFYDLSPYVPKSVCSRYEKAIDRLYFDGAAVLGNPDGQVAPVRLRGNLRNPPCCLRQDCLRCPNRHLQENRVPAAAPLSADAPRAIAQRIAINRKRRRRKEQVIGYLRSARTRLISRDHQSNSVGLLLRVPI
jgi:hypothetical protein